MSHLAGLDLTPGEVETWRTRIAAALGCSTEDARLIRNALFYAFVGTSVKGGIENFCNKLEGASLDWLEQEMHELGCITAPRILEWTESAKGGVASENITIEKPAGVVRDDLMLASISTRDNTTLDMTEPSGWTLLFKKAQASACSLGVFYKIAEGIEPLDYTWTGIKNSLEQNQQAYGSIIRLDMMDGSNPINAFAVNQNTPVFYPRFPSVATTVERCKIVRIGAFAGTEWYFPDRTGLSDNIYHKDVVQAVSNNVGAMVSCGIGHRIKVIAGSVAPAKFDLSVIRPSVCATVTVAPSV